MTASEDSEHLLTAVIIGAGFAGIAMANRLRKLGLDDFVILEKGASPGGVWRENTYPGAACDIPSFLYSFSFDQRSDWSRRFPSQPEILDYLISSAKKFDLDRHMRFQTEVSTARFDLEESVWKIETRDGKLFVASHVIFACGQLNRPLVPDLPGLSSFSGPQFHSAEWDHSVSLTGKRVAVIGNGASAIQFVPRIVDEVESLRVFQRSPNWIMRKRDREITKEESARISKYPLVRWFYRAWTFLIFECRLAVFYKMSPAGWALKQFLNRYRKRRVTSSDLEKNLTPDFPVGCKRILLSSEWFKTLEKPNVSVDATGAAEVALDAVIGGGGESFSADVILFATGFKSTEFLAPIEITGREGRRLQDSWHQGAEAYLGMTVSGFPNLFVLYGPNTNLGHNSIVMMLESQAKYIATLVARMKKRQTRSVEVRPEVQEQYNQKIQKQAKRTVWVSNCENWYTTAEGKVVNNWPFSTLRYFLATRSVKDSNFLFGE